MKLVDVKPRRYNDFSKEIIYQGPKFKAGDIVTISKKINYFFQKAIVPHWFLSSCD